MKLYNAHYPGQTVVHRTPNRYAQIHILFRELAKAKLPENSKSFLVTQKTAEVKQYWKNFFSVSSLRDLTDGQLSNLTTVISKRLETIKKLKA